MNVLNVPEFCSLKKAKMANFTLCAFSTFFFFLSISVFMPLPTQRGIQRVVPRTSGGWTHYQSQSAACWKNFPCNPLQQVPFEAPVTAEPHVGPPHPPSLCAAEHWDLIKVPTKCLAIRPRESKWGWWLCCKFSIKLNNRFATDFSF